eukprot:7048667-Prymnesium_polylepis.2
MFTALRSALRRSGGRRFFFLSTSQPPTNTAERGGWTTEVAGRGFPMGRPNAFLTGTSPSAVSSAPGDGAMSWSR